ncbi:MAG TPA: serine/threonine-protein kinase [Polyangiaceae bacterium]|nr:serine/threonine-protein kinase [Polyangiaceae bacterium]
MEAAAAGSIIANRYRLLRKLGAGGMGSVWLAHDQSLDSQCAIKLVDPEKAANEEVRVRFEREAKAAAQIRGVNVVDIFDHGIFDGIPYIVMEFLEGEDLGARLDRNGPLDLDQTYQVIAQVARALVRAHANGIVHRDLKPENIFLVPGDDAEVAKVLDFGIAKHEQYSLAGKTTKTGSFMGTPYYMSPEQARGKQIDWRSDLWALGVIVFQCLTGRPPFESEALGELMGMIIYDPIPKITERNPRLPASLDAWWSKAVAREREERFQSAKELADAFADAIVVAKRLQVPSIQPRPRMATLSDADGTGPQSIRYSSPSLNPAPADQSSRFSAPPILNDFSQVELGTGNPVSRTRRSVLPELASLPRKQRVIVLSVGGALLAVLGFLVIASLRSAPERASGTNAPAASALPAPTSSISVTPAAPATSNEPPPIIFEPSALPKEEDGAKEKEDDDKKKKRTSGSAAGAPARPAEATRDYGI